jgi:hypothetical protein
VLLLVVNGDDQFSAEYEYSADTGRERVEGV